MEPGHRAACRRRHSLTATATDAAGNTGATSAATLVTIDTAAPSAPSIASFSDDSGVVGDGITNDDTLTLSGTAEAGSTVTVYDGTTLLGTATANGSGAWSYTTATLSNGAHSFTATASDAAGNASVASAATLVTIDTTEPTAPSIASFSDDSGVAGDGVTNDDTLTLTGTAEAGSTVTVHDGAAVLGTATANGSGDWNLATGPLADGAHSFTATATDTAGNTSVASTALDVTVDTANPNAPTDTDSSDNTVGENAANGSDVGIAAFAGDAGGGAVTYSLDDDAGGRFTIDPETGAVTVANGSLLDYEVINSHSITVRATDQAGNFSTASFDISVTDVVETPELQPVFSLPGDTEFSGSRSSIVTVDHSDTLEISQGSISFSFNADRLSRFDGLISKDATDYDGGGNHFSAYIYKGTLYVRFESADGEVTFAAPGISPNQTYEVLATFDNDEVMLYVNDVLVDSADFTMDWTQNTQYMQIGGYGGRSDSGSDAARFAFDGTISDVMIFDQAITPGDLDALA